MALNRKQKSSVAALHNAFEKARLSGLEGGVYDGTFCVWPEGSFYPYESGRNFFRSVDAHGVAMSEVRMKLDGGSGV